MLKKLLKAAKGLTKPAAIACLVVLLPRMITTLAAAPYRHAPADAPASSTALVFGAAIYRNGHPTAVLRDRLDTAIQLYRQGTVSKLLMSGHASEPSGMRDYAIAAGVPRTAVLLDEGGVRTYDSCYRAKHTYGLQSVLLVTQAFHLPRALYICRQMGIQAQGVTAQESQYWRGAKVFWNLRETLATVVALWEIHITRPVPAEIK